MEKRTVLVKFDPDFHPPVSEIEMIISVPDNEFAPWYVDTILWEILSNRNFAWAFVDGLS